MQRCQVTLQAACEDSQSHNPENSNGQKPGSARDGIIDPGSDPGMALLYCSHYRCGERSNRNGHPQTHDEHGGEKGGPVTTRAIGDTRQSKEGEADGGDQRSDHQRKLCAITVNQPSGPARKQKHQQNEWDEGRSRESWSIALHLNEIEWEEERDATESAV